MMDNTEITVPDNVGEVILQAKTDRVIWGKTMINLRSISSVVPEAEDIYKDLPLLPPKKYTKTERIKALEHLINGLQKFMDENEHTSKSDDLMALMKKRLLEAQKLPENSLTSNPAKGLLT